MSLYKTILLSLIFQAGIAYNQNFTSFIQNLQDHEYVKAYDNFHVDVKTLMDVDKLKKTWETVQNTSGPLKKHSFLCEQNKGHSKIEYYNLEFKKRNLVMKIISSDSTQISGFFFVLKHQCKEELKLLNANYVDIEMNFKNDTFDIKGSLLTPKDEYKTICIFIHGSGPNDRNESIGPNQPFLDLAIGLSEKGIASYRFDKRTYTYPVKITNPDIYYEVINDVNYLIEQFSSLNTYKKKNLIIIGHSLGGHLTPYILSKNKRIKAGISLNGNYLPLEEKILEQIKYISSLDSDIDSTEQVYIKDVEKKVRYLKDSLDTLSPDSLLPLNLPACYWKSLKEVHPKHHIQYFNQNLLLLHSLRDYQVNSNDINAWKVLADQNDNITLFKYEKLNHLLLEGQGISTPNEYQTEGKVPQYIINDLSSWIKKVTNQ